MDSHSPPASAGDVAVLNKQTGITIGLGVVVLGASVSAAWWFGQWAGKDQAWKQATDTRLLGIEHLIDEGIKDRWTSVDMLRWAHRLRESNPEMNVPDPYPPSRTPR